MQGWLSDFRLNDPYSVDPPLFVHRLADKNAKAEVTAPPPSKDATTLVAATLRPSELLERGRAYTECTRGYAITRSSASTLLLPLPLPEKGTFR